MTLLHPEIQKVTDGDVQDMLSIINIEFPYTKFDEDSIIKKINSENFFLIKNHRNNILVGFLELEFFDKNARLNAVFVGDVFRRQGIAKGLLKKAFKECKKRKIKKIFLLVKKDNFVAKNFYENNGFVFSRIHDKEIDCCEVEVFERII
jgi:ribosomal protein S18 acetylase RimI-like enzyme